MFAVQTSVRAGKLSQTDDPNIMQRTSIDVVIHALDAYPRERKHFVWHLVDAWKRRGHDVKVIRFPQTPRPGSIVLPHLDLSVWPERYRRYIDGLRQPVLNAQTCEARKRCVSRSLIEDRSFKDPVIVKTDANAGGTPERMLRYRNRLALPPLLQLLGDRVLNYLRPWHRRPFLPASQYRIYPSATAVPEGIFRNPNLVVERFMPERDGNDYVLRVYRFLGDRSVCFRLLGPRPVIKAGNYRHMEPCEVDPGIVARRRELGFDYGKFDYVMHGGKARLLDVNPTPGSPGRVLSQQGHESLDEFCQGIDDCLLQLRNA